jgi:hypothetical protein
MTNPDPAPFTPPQAEPAAPTVSFVSIPPEIPLQIAKQYNKDIVIILSFDRVNGKHEYVPAGVGKDNLATAAQFRDWLAGQVVADMQKGLKLENATLQEAVKTLSERMAATAVDCNAL